MLGQYAMEATKLELRGKKMAWTTDHWTGPNNMTYTTLTAHYIDDDWKLQSACLDFKVFHGRMTGENIYNDVILVLNEFKGEEVTVMDMDMVADPHIINTDDENEFDMELETIIGVTDTTGNMGTLGKYLRENGHEHAYCMDHNFHLNAKLAFDGTFQKVFGFCCINL